MSGNLQFNKIMGAVLATGLVIVGGRIFADEIFKTEKPTKPGYLIEVAEAPTEGGAAAVEVAPDWGTVLPTADLAAGEAVFKKCTSCHTITQGGANMTGPNLWGVVGRATGSMAGMSYSDAMMAHAKEAPNWTYDMLNAFLTNPQKAVKGTKMAFVGVKKVEDRVALIAYLRAQGSTGYAIPAPAPAAVAAPTEATSASAESAPAAAPAPAAAH